MVLYPSLGPVHSDAARTPNSPPDSPGSTTSGSPTTAPRRTAGCAVSRSRPIEHGRTAIDIMREANDLGLVATHIPPALQDPQPRPPRSRPVLRRRRRTGHAARRPRRARHASSEDRRRPVHQLHSGALHQLPVRPDDGDDRAGLRRRLRPASDAAGGVPRGGRGLGAVLHRTDARALREARRLDRERLAARSARIPCRPATSG